MQNEFDQLSNAMVAADKKAWLEVLESIKESVELGWLQCLTLAELKITCPDQLAIKEKMEEKGYYFTVIESGLVVRSVDGSWIGSSASRLQKQQFSSRTGDVGVNIYSSRSAILWCVCSPIVVEYSKNVQNLLFF